MDTETKSRPSRPVWINAVPLDAAEPEARELWKLEYPCPDFGFCIGQLRESAVWFCGVSTGSTARDAIQQTLRRAHKSYLDRLDDVACGPNEWISCAEVARAYAGVISKLRDLLEAAVAANA